MIQFFKVIALIGAFILVITSLGSVMSAPFATFMVFFSGALTAFSSYLSLSAGVFPTDAFFAILFLIASLSFVLIAFSVVTWVFSVFTGTNAKIGK